MNNIELCINLLERIKDDKTRIEEKERLYKKAMSLEWSERVSIYEEIGKYYANVSKENYKRTLMLVRKLLKEEYE